MAFYEKYGGGQGAGYGVEGVEEEQRDGNDTIGVVDAFGGCEQEVVYVYAEQQLYAVVHYLHDDKPRNNIEVTINRGQKSVIFHSLSAR